MTDLSVYFSDNYTASKYAFDTTRKSGHVAEAIKHEATLVAPDTPFDPTRVHFTQYVNAVQTGTPRYLAESQGFDWDEGLAIMAQAHLDGLVSATNRVIKGTDKRSGSLSSGLHHASFTGGAGFCTYNGLAAAATAAIDAGCENVLCLDFDAHCGGGTFDIMGDNPAFTQIDVSVSMYDTYAPGLRHTLIASRPDRYIHDIVRALDIMRVTPWDFIIYNAGVDPINCSVSAQDIALREMLVSQFIGDTPAVFALAGGYTWGNVTMDELVELHASTVLEWVDAVA